MNKREQAVIDAAFDVYSAWAYAADAVSPFLPALFEALKALDEKRADEVFGEAIKQALEDQRWTIGRVR
jgi:hypothetical protein